MVIRTVTAMPNRRRCHCCGSYRRSSVDHKVIGLQFLVTTLIMLMVGGGLALGVRWQLAFPWERMPILGRHRVQGGWRADRPRNLHDARDHARVGDDLPRDHPDSCGGVRELPDSAADRRG